MDMYDAIYKRKSIRKYTDERLSESTFQKIQNIVDTVERLYSTIDVQIHIVRDGEKIQKISGGIVGSYGKIKAPHYLVLTSEEKEGYLENAGFVLEQVVLALTSMGIGTCWIGGSIKKELLKDVITMKENHIPVIVISFGYSQNKHDFMRSMVGGSKRKELVDIVFGSMNETLKSILDAARVAPSAANSQPWRFFISETWVHLYTVKRIPILEKHLSAMNRIDTGIALSHASIAAKHFGKNIQIEKQLSAESKDYNYIASFQLV